MKEIPTAEEFFEEAEIKHVVMYKDKIIQTAIEFAQIHVEKIINRLKLIQDLYEKGSGQHNAFGIAINESIAIKELIK